MNHPKAPEPVDDEQDSSELEITRPQQLDGNQGIDSPLARTLAWLGNHFFAVTLVLTAALLAWAIGFSGR